MAKMTFELNKQGVAELLKSPEMISGIRGICDSIAGFAGGSGDDAEVYVASTRAVGEVHGHRNHDELLKGLMAAKEA